MSDGFIHWYQPTWSPAGVTELVRALTAAGWDLPNPRTGTILTFDGNAQPIEREDLLNRLALAGTAEMNTHWWLDRSTTDVYYRARRLPVGGVVHEFDLDGVGNQMPRIERDVFRLVMKQPAMTVGAVFDRGGATQDLDWDPIMAGADAPIDVAPDLLVLTPELDRMHPDLPYEHRSHQVAGLVVHDWENLYPAIAEPD